MMKFLVCEMVWNALRNAPCLWRCTGASKACFFGRQAIVFQSDWVGPKTGPAGATAVGLTLTGVRCQAGHIVYYSGTWWKFW